MNAEAAERQRQADSAWVQIRFCALAGRVAERAFHWSEAADCFCPDGDRRKEGDAPYMGNYSFSPRVIEFIEEAVHDALRNLHEEEED